MRGTSSGELARTALLGLALLLLPLGVVAQQGDPDGPQEWSLSHILVELRLVEDGSYHVTERLGFDFRSGTFSFGTRHVPASRMDSLVVAEVTSPDLGPLEFSRRRRGGQVELRWEFAPRSEPGEVTLRYSAFGALREVRDENEIFWAAVGDGWEVPVERAGVTVRVPGSFASSAGELTVEPDATVSRDGEEWVITFPEERLEAGQGYQVRVSFPRVMEGRPVGLADPRLQVLLLSLLIVAAGMVRGAMAVPRWRSGEERPVNAPPALSLSEGAVLLHRGALGIQSAIAATVLQLARDGVVRLVRGDPDDKKKDDEVRVVRVSPSPRSLTPFEAAVLEEVEKWESLEVFSTKGARGKTALVAQAREEGLARGWIRDRSPEARDETARGLLLLAASLVAIPVALIFGLWHFLWGALAFALSLPYLAQGQHKFALTQEGARVQEELVWWLRRLREEIDRTLKLDPIEAASRFSLVFPWLLVDPEEGGKLGRAVAEALKESRDSFPTPSWVEDRSSKARERFEKETAAFAAFATTQEVDSYTVAFLVPHLAGNSGSNVAATSVAAVGAVGAGAAGGGGGGAG